MAEMSREEFLRLQNDAERRLREMQKRSREAVGTTPVMPDFVRVRGDEPAPGEPPKKSLPAPESNGNGLDLLRFFNFKNVPLDSDRLLILAVLLLLSGEGSDRLLLAALVYIML